MCHNVAILSKGNETAPAIPQAITYINLIRRQDATISGLLNKELLFRTVSRVKSLTKLLSPITGYLGLQLRVNFLHTSRDE